MKTPSIARIFGLILLAALLPLASAPGQRMPQDSWYLKKTVETGMFVGGIARDSEGNIYLSDAKLGLIKKFSPTYQLLQTWGGLGTGDGQFGTIAFQPLVRSRNWQHIGAGGLCLTADQELVVCDPANHRVQIFSRDGVFLRKFGSQGSGDGQFQSPVAAAVSADNKIHVADRDNHRVQVFSSAGGFLSKFGTQGSFDGQLNQPSGLAMLPGGGVAVADRGNGRIQIFGADHSYVSKLPGKAAHTIASFSDGGFIAGSPSGLAALGSDGGWGKPFAANRVRVWGSNMNGQANVPADLGPVVKVAAGTGHTVALQADGKVRAWGLSGMGQISVPTDLQTAMDIAAGDRHTVALQTNGLVRAWGANVSGQTTVPSDLGPVVAVAAGYNHTVALQSNGIVRAWGANLMGQTNVPGDLDTVVAIVAGSYYTMVLQANGVVRAWGQAPASTVPSDLDPVAAIAAGASHSLALQSDGTLRAWGGFSPVTLPGDLGPVNLLATGPTANHSLVSQSDGTVQAWGNNGSGQTNVPTDLKPVADLAAGSNFSVAVEGTREVFHVCSLPDGGVLASDESGALLHYARTFRTILPEAPNAIPMPVVLATTQRPGSGLVDVDFRVEDADDATVHVAALAFRNGGTGLGDVIPIRTLTDGTAGKLSAGIATGQVHRFTWDATTDLDEEFEQLQIEILARDGRDLFNLDFIQIPAEEAQPSLKISKTPLKGSDFESAWLWLIATNDPEISFSQGTITDPEDEALLGGTRWIALQTTAVRGPSTSAIQLSEFEFYDGTSKVPMAGVIVTNPGFTGGDSEGPAKAADELLNTKWLDYSFEPGERLIFEFPSVISFDSYRFATGGDVQDRDPISWNLQTSSDGVNWMTIDSRTNANVPITRRAWTENFAAVVSSAAGRAFLLGRMGLREATAAEVLRAKEAGTPGVINQWEPPLQVGPGERPMKVNAYGFETGDSGVWVVPVEP